MNSKRRANARGELGRLAEPFDHPDWVFELKYDGFRSVARISDGKAELISRRGNTYKSWAPLREDIGREFGDHRAILDGELVCLDDQGRPVFLDMLRRRRPPVFVAFDLIYLDGEDLRALPLLERKRRRREVVPRGSSAILYAQPVHQTGHLLFAEACRLDREGIVGKLADAPHRVTDPPH